MMPSAPGLPTPVFFLILSGVALMGAFAVSRVGTSGWNWFVALFWFVSVAVQFLAAVFTALNESGGRL